MSELTQKIARTGRVILILTTVARILLDIVLAVTVFLLISTWFPGDKPILTFGGTEVYATMPLKALVGIDLTGDMAAQLNALRLNLGGQLVAFVLAQVMLRLVARLFTRIQQSESPFAADVVKTMKALAILMGLMVATQNTIVGMVVAFAIFAFALIFEYGGELQNQVDETL